MMKRMDVSPKVIMHVCRYVFLEECITYILLQDGKISVNEFVNEQEKE